MQTGHIITAVILVVVVTGTISFDTLTTLKRSSVPVPYRIWGTRRRVRKTDIKMVNMKYSRRRCLIRRNNERTNRGTAVHSETGYGRRNLKTKSTTAVQINDVLCSKRNTRCTQSTRVIIEKLHCTGREIRKRERLNNTP